MNIVKESYKDGTCPDCNENIPDEVDAGDACSNCGHVFYGRPDYGMSTYDKFYHRVSKDPSDMSNNELDFEMEACQEWEKVCVAIGQGINSKEVIRERSVQNELIARYIARFPNAHTHPVYGFGHLSY